MGDDGFGGWGSVAGRESGWGGGGGLVVRGWSSSSGGGVVVVEVEVVEGLAWGRGCGGDLGGDGLGCRSGAVERGFGGEEAVDGLVRFVAYDIFLEKGFEFLKTKAERCQRKRLRCLLCGGVHES